MHAKTTHAAARAHPSRLMAGVSMISQRLLSPTGIRPQFAVFAGLTELNFIRWFGVVKEGVTPVEADEY